jgi:hypothetical protein
MIALLLLAVAARAAWPRFESAAMIGKRELLAIHVPKAGGTSFFRALEVARCETASWTKRGAERLLPTCRAFCDEYYKTNTTLEKTNRLEGRRASSCLGRRPRATRSAVLPLAELPRRGLCARASYEDVADAARARLVCNFFALSRSVRAVTPRFSGGLRAR